MERETRFELATPPPWQGGALPLSYSRMWWTMTGSNCRHPACKAGALPAELIVHVVTRPGIEPGIPP